MMKLVKSILFISTIFICIFNLNSNYSIANAQDDEAYIRVGLLQGKTTINISADNDFVIKDADNNKNYKYTKGSVATISQQDRTVFVGKTGKITTTLVVAVKNDAPVSVNGQKYRGALIIQPHKTGLTVINRLPIEQYLYGVIPKEMPSTWSIEALKAQAIAARTYALYYKQQGKYRSQGFDVTNTTDSQVYGGLSAEMANSNNAVDATKGQILTYINDDPICAVFHSASGGYTENSEDVWGTTIPYLRAVDDSGEVSPYENWIKNVKISDFTRIIDNNYSDIGTIKQINIVDDSQKTVKAVQIVGSNKKSVEVTSTQMRNMLGLNSSNFQLNVIDDKQKVNNSAKQIIDKPDDETLNIVGSGLGHRLGMSQWGAKSLAEQGKNYQQILNHYYTNVKIKSIY